MPSFPSDNALVACKAACAASPGSCIQYEVGQPPERFHALEAVNRLVGISSATDPSDRDHSPLYYRWENRQYVSLKPRIPLLDVCFAGGDSTLHAWKCPGSCAMMVINNEDCSGAARSRDASVGYVQLLTAKGHREGTTRLRTRVCVGRMTPSRCRRGAARTSFRYNRRCPAKPGDGCTPLLELFGSGEPGRSRRRSGCSACIGARASRTGR